jgi:hypothetical protein
LGVRSNKSLSNNPNVIPDKPVRVQNGSSMLFIKMQAGNVGRIDIPNQPKTIRILKTVVNLTGDSRLNKE